MLYPLLLQLALNAKAMLIVLMAVVFACHLPLATIALVFLVMEDVIVALLLSVDVPAHTLKLIPWEEISKQLL